MKKLLMLLLLLSALPVLAQTKTFLIAFDYAEADLSDSNIVFRVHSSQTVIAPVETWQANPGVALTNGFANTWRCESTNAGIVTLVSTSRFTATAPKTFFAVSASNEWGIVFSEAIATGPAARAGKIRLR